MGKIIKDTTISLRVPAEVKEKFKKACSNHSTTPSQQLRIIVDQLIAEDEKEEKEFAELVERIERERESI